MAQKNLDLPKIARGKLGLLQLQMNVAIGAAYALVATVAMLPLPAIGKLDSRFVVVGVLTILGSRYIGKFQDLLDRFKPDTALDAKRLNEQLKLMASMMNTVAAAFVSILAISEIAKEGKTVNTVNILVAGAIALWLHMGARGILLHLKDEATTAYTSVNDVAVSQT